MKNKRKALAIAKKALAQTNPSPRKKQTGVQKHAGNIVAIDNMAMEMASGGVDISSLSDAEWLELLKGRGMSDDEAMMALENLAAYGVTDGP
jgi:hypothetical protein